MKKTAIYLDYNATTPVDPQVFAAMEPYFQTHFGNPASASHLWGWTAESAVNKARQQVGHLIGALPHEIYFTSGATEANNWALFGLITQWRIENPQGPIHIITSQAEHSSVLQTLKTAAQLGIEVDFAPVDADGIVDVNTIEKLIKPHTKLFSFMWVNNESGSINPVQEIGELARRHQIYFHTDATQAVGKIPMNLQELPIDLLSFSGHKIYGPKGVGALFVRSKNPKVQIHAYLMGGGQERGLRSGTLNVPGIVGLGAAALLCESHLLEERERMGKLQKTFWEQLQKEIPDIELNGPALGKRALNNLNVYLPRYSPATALAGLQNLAVSAGSACSSGAVYLSHVLKSMGHSTNRIESSLRLSLGRPSTEDDIRHAVDLLKALCTSQECSIIK